MNPQNQQQNQLHRPFQVRSLLRSRCATTAERSPRKLVDSVTKEVSKWSLYSSTSSGSSCTCSTTAVDVDEYMYCCGDDSHTNGEASKNKNQSAELTTQALAQFSSTLQEAVATAHAYVVNTAGAVSPVQEQKATLPPKTNATKTITTKRERGPVDIDDYLEDCSCHGDDDGFGDCSFAQYVETEQGYDDYRPDDHALHSVRRYSAASRTNPINMHSNVSSASSSTVMEDDDPPQSAQTEYAWQQLYKSQRYRALIADWKCYPGEHDYIDEVEISRGLDGYEEGFGVYNVPPSNYVRDEFPPTIPENEGDGEEEDYHRRTTSANSIPPCSAGPTPLTSITSGSSDENEWLPQRPQSSIQSHNSSNASASACLYCQSGQCNNVDCSQSTRFMI